MTLLTDLFAWLGNPANWQGDGGVPARVAQHMGYSLGATVVATAIALPLALWIGHTGRGGTLAINIANVGRAVPTFGLILAAFVLFGFSLIPVYVALVLMAIPPILTNGYVGIREVDPEVREAAQGMGMKGREVLTRVELPIALPLIMTGIRTSAVQVVATATLAAFIGLGGLGRYIIDGLAQGAANAPGDPRSMLIVGAATVAILSILTELILSRVERILVPAALQRKGRPAIDIAEPAGRGNPLSP
jgi:osmoprotectant transport system permease protein